MYFKFINAKVEFVATIAFSVVTFALAKEIVEILNTNNTENNTTLSKTQRITAGNIRMYFAKLKFLGII